MTISFDLDGTLIPFQKDDFPTEKRQWWQRLLGIELIRKGAVSYVKKLRKEGHRVGIYTTSHRSPIWIFFQLLTYEVRVDFIVNESLNRRTLKNHQIRSSKHPPSFNIDLHIDDQKGVEMEAFKFNFKTLIIHTKDLNWTRDITHFISNVESKQ